MNATGKLDWFSIRFYGTSAVGLGTGITTIVLMVLWRSRGMAWSWQPGHVMLLWIGYYELATISAVAVDVTTHDPSMGYDPFRQRIYEVEGLVQHCGVILILVVCLSLLRFSRLWRVVFGLVIFLNLLILALMNPLQLPMGQFISFEMLRRSANVMRIVVFGMVPLLALWELVQREQRDWLHWVGIVILLLHYAKWMNYLAGF
ncbi:hypothetical protein [Bremerella volcania]|uniref:hypothetical protein n=1 Tax=Bremerella volcania TaxID=2527984 RepID=UPI0013FD0766|nr:hypothetical protein [Bremerella volcania]